eukprot:TRINITY_DN7004_c1_g1_i1.p1 TRINITY_DN7004_c1_g1~~TRINITY_DN7004_c1_g1_i1.p1  ORF type:complete len:180 (+),score=67.67 TRINITY_DN7004_c1_g1_i1:62-601(+)
MGNVIHSRILVLGIDGSGKTTFLNKFEKPDEDVPTQPTDAYVVRDVKVKGVKLNVWDVAGKDSTRSLWKHYYGEGSTNAIIWVIDSTVSDERLEENKLWLSQALMAPNLSGVLLFVLANKQDVDGARKPEDISKLLNLAGQEGKRPYHIYGISAKTGAGIKEAMDALAKELKVIEKQKK